MQDLITAAIEASKKNRETKEHGTFRTYVETFAEIEKLVKRLKREASKVTCPVFFIHSLEDTWYPIENSIDLCNDVSSEEKSLLLVNNCNHVLTVDLRKYEIAAEVRRFVEKHAAAAARKKAAA
jgi:esterase/lipase